jgi:Cu2+-containing amine oxidase
MEDKCQGKSIPWTDMEHYLALHQEVMEPFVPLGKSKLIKIEMIESSLPLQFLKMHELITKILKQCKVFEEED